MRGPERVATRKELQDLARRLGEAPGHLTERVYISVSPSHRAAACMFWEDRAKPPLIRCNEDFASRFAPLELEALCAHEYRHLMQWWGCQERFCFRNPDLSVRPIASDPKAICMHGFFEYRSDAFAADFTDTATTISMLRKTDAWALENPGGPEMARLQPHPPFEKRIDFLTRRDARRKAAR